jgi:excisionase family DNA binding protein
MTDELKNQLDRIERNTLIASKNVLTLEDVSVLTGFSKGHLYQLTYKHKIPFYKLNGKSLYFDRKEIETWLKGQRIASNEELKRMADNVELNGEGGLK